MERNTTINTLDALFAALKSGEIELTDSLPTFGGQEPENTDGIWSWDADRLLIGSCVDDLTLGARDDCWQVEIYPDEDTETIHLVPYARATRQDGREVEVILPEGDWFSSDDVLRREAEFALNLNDINGEMVFCVSRPDPLAATEIRGSDVDDLDQLVRLLNSRPTVDPSELAGRLPVFTRNECFWPDDDSSGRQVPDDAISYDEDSVLIYCHWEKPGEQYGLRHRTEDETY